MKWSKTKSIITIEHLAGGSQLCVFQYQNGSWHRHPVDPPCADTDFDAYDVNSLRIEGDYLFSRYIVCFSDHTKPIENCSFKIKLVHYIFLMSLKHPYREKTKVMRLKEQYLAGLGKMGC